MAWNFDDSTWKYAMRLSKPGGRGAIILPDFGTSVNPYISIRGADYARNITYYPLVFSDLPTAL